MSKISTNYTFTINNWTDEHVSMLATLSDGSDSIKCIFYGEEIGESGTPHLQGFMVFKTKKSMRQVIKVMPGAHLEVMKGSIKQNLEYCKKGGKTTLHGILPLTQKEKGKKEKDRWDVARAAAIAGDLEKIDSDIYVRCYGTLKRIAADHAPPMESNATLDNHWYWGSSGTGKSSLARKENPEAYIKLNNKWWDGYNGQDVVIIDDFDKYDVALSGHLKRWCDHYPFPAEIKGGVKVIRPKKLIVTSNYPPESIWEEEATLGPIRRRFKVTHFDKPFDKKKHSEGKAPERPMP